MPKNSRAASNRVDLKTLEGLEASLLALAEHYALGGPDERRLLREQVIRAKDRVKFASRNQKAAPDKRAVKAEMGAWLLVWLGDPAMFGAWATLRKTALAATAVQ